MGNRLEVYTFGVVESTTDRMYRFGTLSSLVGSPRLGI